MAKEVSVGDRVLLVRGGDSESDGLGIAVFFPLTVSWTDVEDLPFDVTIGLDAGPTDNHLEVRSLEVRARDGGAAITSTALRALPFGRIRDAAIRAGSVPIDRNTEGVPMITGLPGLPRRSLDRSALRAATARKEATPGAGPGARLSDEHLARVARIYRQAVADRKPTRAAIQQEMGPAALGTVARWVHEARRREDPATGEPFLGPARGRRAGEV